MRTAVLLFCATVALGQPPIISSIRNAASLREGPIANQSLILIQGTNLASTTTTATYPWPKSLAGTSVAIDQADAAIYYVSPTNVIAMVSEGFPTFPGPKPGQGSLTIATALGKAVAHVDGRPTALAIF